jgi:hypothetical protein
MLVPDNFQPPPPEDRDRTSRPEPLDGNDSYEIDKIIAKKTAGRKTTYQVLWKGYPDNEPFDIVQASDINQEALDRFTRFDQANRKRAAPVLNQIISEFSASKSRERSLEPETLPEPATTSDSAGRPPRRHNKPAHLNEFVTSAMHVQEKDNVLGLTADFYLQDSSGVLEALKTLMPSPNGWTKGHATRLLNQLQGGTNFLQPEGSYTPGQPQRIATTELEIRALLEVVDFSLISSIVDTFSGTGTIKDVFAKEANLQVLSNDVDSRMEAYYHLDALQPSTYSKIKKEYGLDAVVISPTFAFLDLALPLAVLHANQLVCCHVPGHYLTGGPAARFEWMRHLQKQNRLHILSGLPVGPSHRRCLWLLIFKSEGAKRILLRPGCEQYIGFSIDKSRLLNKPEPLYQEINGDLLEAKEHFIAHQCVCSARLERLARCKGDTYSSIIPGLAGKIFTRYPSSNIYMERGENDVNKPGSIALRGKVFALFAQIGPGHHNSRTIGDDTAELRLQYFMECLQRIGHHHPRPQSIAFPYGIGCGMAGGHWNSYRDAIQQFATEFSIKTVVYRLHPELNKVA